MRAPRIGRRLTASAITVAATSIVLGSVPAQPSTGVAGPDSAALATLAALATTPTPGDTHWG